MIKTLRIQLTDECNLKCVFCCHEGTNNEYSIQKNRNLISFIRAAYDVLEIHRVKFTGGEPLEYDESIVNLINKIERPNIQYSIVTNATNYPAFIELVDVCSNIDVTVSLPVPPNIDYLKTYKKITGATVAKKCFESVMNCMEYMVKHNREFKINYVLCKNRNTASDQVKEMIAYAQAHPNVQLRFLETAVNNTNNRAGRMSAFVVTQKEFEDVLVQLGYRGSVENKVIDKRSFAIYNLNGCMVKFIKFFCSSTCENCPEDKTSLWLTSTGHIKKCSYRVLETEICNWKYDKLTHLLGKEFL